MRALVIEYGTNRGALAATRALSSSGWTVGVGATDGGGMTASSRSVSYEHRIPRPDEGRSAFVAAVNDAVEARRYEVVFPVDDAQVLALSECRSEIAARVPYGPHESVVLALDKLQLTAAARRAGLSTPETVVATEGIPANLHGPLAVKARSYVSLGGIERPGRAETELLEPHEAAHRIAEIRAAGGEALIQEFAPGRLLSLVVVTDRNSRIAASSQQIADRIWPPRAGVSAFARTTPVDADLLARVQQLLDELQWFGLAQIQFLQPEHGEPRLIDFNARFYGSLALALGSGVNLPALWAGLATGRSTATQAHARPDVRYQWLEGDLRRAFAERRGGLLCDVLTTVRAARGSVHSVWRRDDPRPAVHVLIVRLRRAIRWMRRAAG